MTGRKNKIKDILQPIKNIFSIILYLFNLMWKRIDKNIISIVNLLIIVLPTIIVYCFSFLHFTGHVFWNILSLAVKRVASSDFLISTALLGQSSRQQ